MRTIDCTHEYGQTGRNRRNDFWRYFLAQQSRRRSIAARLRYVLAAQADPASLTPGQVENIPGKIARLLADLGGVPAYRSKLAEVWPSLSLFSSAAEDWLADYAAERWRDRVLDAKAEADAIYAATAPKMPREEMSDKQRHHFLAAKKRAELMLIRKYPGLTKAEGRFAMSAFGQFRRPE